MDDRGMPDADAGYVGDRVARSGWQCADRDPEVAKTWTAWL
jgi:hypothetical protein